MITPSLIINKYKYLIALGVFIIYLFISFYKISVNSLWYDEAFSIDLANCSLEEITHYSLYYDTNPPLYLYILHYWMLFFGESELALRSLSAISVSLGCGIFFLLCNRFFNWQTAIFAILLFFVSNDLFYYAQEGRTYGLVILFGILSTFSFLSLIDNPNWKNALCLGIFNSVIFYLHTLASFIFVAQILLIPFLVFQTFTIYKKSDLGIIIFGYRLKHILFYLFSWLTFYVLFIPWQERFFGILSANGGAFWLGKPSFEDLNNCLYDVFNGQITFIVFLIVAIIILLLFSVKKYIHDTVSFKTLLIPLVIGPMILFLSYYLSITITPIFLKRYVLFTTIGFILLLAYLLSAVKIRFRLKLIFFIPFFALLFINMKIPRESVWDYREGMNTLNGKINKNTFVATDVPILFSYYGDIPGAFAANWHVRDSILNLHNVFTLSDSGWTKRIDFSPYKDIYFVESYSQNYDPACVIVKELNTKFNLISSKSFKGINVFHFKKMKIDTVKLNSIIRDIKSDKNWLYEVEKIAIQKNRIIDSVLYDVAVWQLKNQKN